MSNTPILIQNLDNELKQLRATNTWKQVQRVILSVIKLLDQSIDINNQNAFSLFSDSDGKIRANAAWFFEDTTLADRKATYKITTSESINIDFKLYGLNKPSKRTISWIQALTPNFEDEPFNGKYNLGIDFVIPKTYDKVIVVLSNNYVVRTLELKDQLTVTFQEIFDKWQRISNFENKKEVHNILWSSFDLKPLNEKFYEGINQRFLLLKQHLTGQNILDDKHSSMFTNRLIGRVIFCWFLDKKRILNADQKYFDAKVFSDSTTYYKEKLEKLFFEILNTPIENRRYPDKVTPFLNGGLFEVRTNDLYQDNKLTFPANYFDSLFEFLSAYNFTTDESTSQFQQVAIDPEMLGRIFENLLAEINEDTGEQARKAKGAFYTPREIVDYMCKESLREYLKTKLQEDEYRDRRLEQLIDEPDHKFQDQDHNWRRDWKPYKDEIVKALDDMKVIDIACGSGAFPIGMMQLLLKVYERLEARFDPYKTKLQVIEQNIFGVDIEPMAVEIARLRAWLSIVVDEEADSRNIKPLPNLEFKFVCANSLISLDDGKSEARPFFDDPDLDQKLQKIRDQYFNTEDVVKKKRLRNEYQGLVEGNINMFGETRRTKQLRTYKPFDNENSAEFFDPDFMFGIEKFDVVIGNPPYVRQEKIKDVKDALKVEYSGFYNGRSDLYTYFIYKGINILKASSILCFIVSNKFMVRGYGENTRLLLANSFTINQLINFGELPVFQASVDSIIIIGKKSEPSPDYHLKYLQVKEKKQIENLFNTFKTEHQKLLQTKLSKSEWSLNSYELHKILDKVRKYKLTLQEFYNQPIYAGIKTGYDEAFVISEETKNHIINLDPKSTKIIKPWLKGKDVRKWKAPNTKLSLIYIPTSKYQIDEYPLIKEHLIKFKSKLESRATSQQWFEIQQAQEKFTSLFESDKIIYPDCAKEMRAMYDQSKTYGTMAMYFIPYNPIILGILNSKLFDWYSRMTFATFGDPWNGGRIIFKTIYMSKFPIPPLNNVTSSEIKKRVENLIESINHLEKESIEFIENEIDNLVFRLYEISQSEKDLILQMYRD